MSRPFVAGADWSAAAEAVAGRTILGVSAARQLVRTLHPGLVAGQPEYLVPNDDYRLQ